MGNTFSGNGNWAGWLAKGKAMHPRTVGMWKSFGTLSRLVEAVREGP